MSRGINGIRKISPSPFNIPTYNLHLANQGFASDSNSKEAPRRVPIEASQRGSTEGILYHPFERIYVRPLKGAWDCPRNLRFLRFPLPQPQPIQLFPSYRLRTIIENAPMKRLPCHSPMLFY